MNEDVDLSIRLSRIGPILFCPQARLAHFHDPAGRVAPRQGAEDDVFNRFFVLYRTAGHTRWRALGLVAAFVLVESASNAAGALRRLQWRDTGRLIAGRFSGLRQAVAASRRSA